MRAETRGVCRPTRPRPRAGGPVARRQTQATRERSAAGETAHRPDVEPMPPQPKGASTCPPAETGQTRGGAGGTPGTGAARARRCATAAARHGNGSWKGRSEGFPTCPSFVMGSLAPSPLRAAERGGCGGMPRRGILMHTKSRLTPTRGPCGRQRAADGDRRERADLLPAPPCTLPPAAPQTGASYAQASCQLDPEASCAPRPSDGRLSHAPLGAADTPEEAPSPGDG